jgi:hypothetical protein
MRLDSKIIKSVEKASFHRIPIATLKESLHGYRTNPETT